MTSTTRIQNRYDHLLREHVRSTGDVNYAIQLGVPRSTARGWVNSTPAEVVTLDIVDMDNVRLQQQVLRLQSRLDWVIAILRLFVVVLKTSDISLSRVRFSRGNREADVASSHQAVVLRPSSEGRLARRPLVALSISCVEAGGRVRFR